MKNYKTFIVAMLLVHLLLFVSFQYRPGSFWISFLVSWLILSGFAVVFIKMDTYGPWLKNLWIGIWSGAGLYLIFLVGKLLIELLFPSLIVQLEELYAVIQPVAFWHYLVLFIIVIPGEELFWRGYVLKKLAEKYSPWIAIVVSILLYAAANIYAGSVLLLLASLFAGAVWSIVYLYTRNIWAVIVSHLVFDLLLLVIFPLL